MEIRFKLPQDINVGYPQETAGRMVGKTFKLRYGRESWTATVLEATWLSASNSIEILAEIPSQGFDIVHNVFESFPS